MVTSSDDSPVPMPDKRRFAPVPQPFAKKQPYRAFETGSEEKRHLEIRLRYPEPAECPSNGMLTNIRADWRGGQSITLIYGTTLMVMIRGENLTEAYRALKTWKVEWIAEFNAEDYDPPTDDSAPFIQSITILTTRPEETPPVTKRH